MGFFDFFDHLEIFDGVWTDFSEIEDVYNGCMVGVCVICAGIAAGLTVGLLSLDITKLEIKLMIGNDAEKEAASSILPIVKQHHLLLVTLLLFNSIANETLPIFLGALVPNYIAVILSVTLVLIFGEIIPSALFTGPDQLLTAAKLTNLVYFLLFFFYPISWPLSKILDFLFGLEENAGSITREELEALVLLQSDAGEAIISELTSNSRGNSGRGNASASNSVPSSPIRYNSKSNSNNNRKNHHHEIQVMNEESPLLSRATSNDLPNNNSNKGYSSIQKTNKALTRIAEKAEIPATSNAATAHQASSSSHSHAHSHSHPHTHPQYSLTINEVSLMTGILRLSKFTVKDAMIPIRRVSMISSSTRLDEKSLYDILDSGFSRIPVYKRHDKQHILGYLLVKELIVVRHSH